MGAADNVGNVTKVVSDGGTINYTYYSCGSPSSITSNGIETTFICDEYGRQTSMTEPNSGTTSYTYNSLGQLLTQTDGNEKTHTLTYDEYGRLDSETNSDGDITDYEYVTSGNGKGMLDYVEGPTGIKNEFTYDILGRIISETETLPDDKIFTT